MKITKIILILILLYFAFRKKRLLENFGTDGLNIYNEELSVCSVDPLTGWFRDGKCNTDSNDHGTHTVCAQVTNDFLDFTLNEGNDLTNPRGSFPGLKEGDRWCLCAIRWENAYKANKAPPVILDSTHKKTLDYVSLDILEENSISD